MDTLQAMAVQQSLLSFQLLQYHILMPSLLLSQRGPSSSESSESSDCPNRPIPLENIRAAKLSNQLAINEMSQLVLGMFAAYRYPKKVPEPDTAVPPLCGDDGNGCEPGHRQPPMPMCTDVTETDGSLCTSNVTETEKSPPVSETTTPVSETTTETSGPVTPVNETTAKAPGQFPYLVSLQVANAGYTYFRHLCGGIIIAPTWVLTAAHCLDSERPEELAIVAGEMNMNIIEGTEEIYRVDYFIQHPNYTYYQTPYQHDIGLVRLAGPILENDYVKIAPLPTYSYYDTEGTCFEAGWGAPGDSRAGSPVLKVSSVPFLRREQCEGAYDTPIGENSVCAGKEGEGACVGDNGGPLICDTFPVAIMSWREGCARAGRPAVYMDIVKYLPWIRQKTGLSL